MPANEAEPLAMLHSPNILDTLPEERFDRITRIAARLFDMPIALISLIHTDGHRVKACYGLPLSETLHLEAFCGHMFLDDDIFFIPEAHLDSHFANNPVVADEPLIRFYAGQPLSGPDGSKLGALCLIDHCPRQFDEADQQALRDLAAWAEKELNAVEPNREVANNKQVEAERAHFTNQLRTASDITRQLTAILDPDQLLNQIVSLLQARFDLYHVHIYLLDEALHNLVMEAGSGEAGKIMRQQGHQIPFEYKHSIVARAARSQEIVAIEDVSQEPDFMPNPLLPDTRSEMAVPLIASGQLLGVLDVQRDKTDCFISSDLDTFNTLAGQIAIALQNAHLFEESQQTAQRLRELDQLKSDFLANMSHELRTPLNSITGYAEMILMDMSGEIDNHVRKDVQAIYDNGQQLVRLVNDILDLAKIEAGRLTLNFEEISIGGLLDDIKTSSIGLLVNNPLDLMVEVEKDLPWIHADYIRLNQILNNLVSNAIKFTHEGHISLRAFRENEWVSIEVEDTGIGISQANLETIFDKFRQVDGSFTRRAEGTGLGLAITRHLVEMHGGQIEIQSQLGRGTNIMVRLPIEPQKENVLLSQHPEPC